MNPFVSLIFFSSFLLLLQTSPAAATGHHDIVIDTCKSCARSDPKVKYTLCVASLDSVPRSHHSDLTGLGVISTRIALANASKIVSKVNRILKRTSSQKLSPYLKSCLDTCLELYSDSVSNLMDSARAIRARRYEDANLMLSAAVDAPCTCEDGFKEGKVKSPLTRENDEFFWLSVIALGITALLQGGGQ